MTLLTIDPRIEALEPELIAHRRHFHAHPEASLKEYETAKYVKAELDKLGIPYETVGETGVLGRLGGHTDGPTVLLRADMDALELVEQKTVDYRSQNEGLCHACGHDAHTAALLGAAKVLKEREDEIKGTVKLCFQPAEEIGAGARLFVQAGHLDDVDLAFGIHVASRTPSGQITIAKGPRNASCDIFKIRVHGKASHAAAPHNGFDAVIASAAIVTNLQTIVSRQTDPLQPIVISIGVLQAGTRYNVVANDGYIEGTVRCHDNDVRAQTLERIEQYAAAIASTHGCTTEFSNYDAAAVLINNDEATDYVYQQALKIYPAEQIITESKAGLGAEDFADYTQVVPAAFVHLGTARDEATSVPGHNGAFDIDESQLKTMTQLHVNVALGIESLKK